MTRPMRRQPLDSACSVQTRLAADDAASLYNHKPLNYYTYFQECPDVKNYK